jgi:nucleoside-diphosphate-sugar epimerase
MVIKYSASKMLSEKAAWDYMKEHKPAFDLVVLVPSFVWGVSAYFLHLTRKIIHMMLTLFSL